MKDICIERFVVDFVNDVRKDAPKIGGVKLWSMYRDKFDRQYSVGHNKFADMIARNGLSVRCKRRKSPRTTDSSHDLPKYPDLIKNLIPTRSGQIIVSDITYQPIKQLDGTVKFCFIHLVTDLYSHEILGHVVSPTLEVKYSIQALKQALVVLADRNPGIVPYHHSDRGVQYASILYTTLLKKHNYRISMTQSGNPLDNAVAERVNGILKEEFLSMKVFKDIRKVRRAVEKAVWFYNNRRPHMSNDMLTPAQAALREGILDKKWKSYKEKYMIPIEIDKELTTFAV